MCYTLKELSDVSAFKYLRDLFVFKEVLL